MKTRIKYIPKRTLDERVAAELALPRKVVDKITGTFLRHARACLVEFGAVKLDGLARFIVSGTDTVNPPGRACRVSLRQDSALRKTIRERDREVPYGQIRSRSVHHA